MTAGDHAFVVPAYGFSPHLAECIASLKAQTQASHILVSTSTPNAQIARLCSEEDIPLFIHSPNRGIGNDWNAALGMAGARYVTLAHQDDLYFPDFTRDTMAAFAGARQSLLAFTDYVEIGASGIRARNRLLWIKQLLLQAGFLGRARIADGFSKRNVVRFACPIPCPAVTIDTRNFASGYDERYQVNLDWGTWVRASALPGEFIWIRKPLMAHRIHESSETSEAIRDGRRMQEDLGVLEQLWPRALARIIAGRYGLAYESNEQ